MKRLSLFILAISVILSACQNTGNNTDLGPELGSRSELLENVTNQIIIPAHENLQYEIENLNTSVINFTNNLTSLTLIELRKAWVQAYVSWQSVEMFAIGKAEEINYTKTMNTYPCNPTQINNNISNQTYNFNDANYPSWTAQGFPAIDYMLYGLDTDSNLILDYYTGVNGVKYLDYLNAIISQMQTNTNLIIEDWQTNKISFISSDMNTAVSSLNILTNDFIYYFEKGLRANKIGIPCGIWNGFQTYEIGVEAYYRKDISKYLTLKSLNACKDFLMGKSINSSTIGSSYMSLLEEQGAPDLSTDILNGLNEAEIVINNLDNNFRLQLNEDNNSMLNTYDALQNVVVLLKVDLLFFLDITVDYTDSDGD